MPAPLGLPPLAPPRLELPPPRRSRGAGWLSLLAHLIVILLAVELTRDANFWDASLRAASGRGATGGGGGGQQVTLIPLPAPP
ncbi:MAG TPA: hypothetical protein VGQ73_03525, partial [Gemmatimonadales bacterium]|nr:hypothetical protein [Gemmatimonadales bacterium]